MSIIYDPYSPTRETTQDDIFRWYAAISNYLGREPDPPHITQLRGIFPDNQLIEVWIAMYGSSSIQWDYGHWKHTRDLLISLYGDALIPYLIERSTNPFHGGGTAYGETHLEKSKLRVKAFCQNTLDTLRGSVESAYRVHLPSYDVIHKPSKKIVASFDSEHEARIYALSGQTELPDDVNQMVQWRPWEYEAQ